MPTNGIKYSVTPQTEALKKGNFWISTGDVDKGPTPSSGYYISITPPSGGYSVYLNKPSDGPSIYTPPNDNDLIVLAQGLAGQTFATGASALNWFASQTDKMACNIDYPPVITNSLQINIDAGFTPSFPRTGLSWYDLSSNGVIGSLTNGPTFDSTSLGNIVFDGTDDFINLPGYSPTLSQATFETTIKPNGLQADAAGVLFFRPAATGINFQYNTGPTLKLGFHWNDQFNTYTWASGPTLSSGLIYQVSLTITPTLATYYINGVASASLSTSLPSVSVTGLVAGRDPYAASRSFKGNMYSSRIYNKSLSSSEVFQNYQTFLSRFIDPGIVTNGLVLYLDAANPFYAGSGTSWADASGSKNTATLVNGPTYATGNGGAIVFDGVDDYSTSSNYRQTNNSQITLDIWVKPTGNPSTDKTTILSKWGSSSLGNFSWLLFINWFGDNTLYFLVGNSSGNNYSTASMTHGLSTTTYANLTITFNAGVVKMYKNGSLLTTTASPYTSLKTVPTPFTIGNDWDGGTPYGSPTRPDTLTSRYWKGNISNIKVYNVALSDNDVLQNYNAQKSRFGL